MLCIKDWLFKEPDNLSNLLGYLLVFLGSAFAIIQWRRDQKWKRKELLISRVSAFNETPGALNALLMLDWSDREIPLWAKDRVEDRYVRVTRTEVTSALIPDTLLPSTYSVKESAIRNSFEDFLIKLSHLEMFLKNKLLKVNEADVIMLSLLNSLNVLREGNDKDRALLRHFYIYIGWRNFPYIKDLFKRFKIDIDQETNVAIELLRQEIANGLWTRN